MARIKRTGKKANRIGIIVLFSAAALMLIALLIGCESSNDVFGPGLSPPQDCLCTAVFVHHSIDVVDEFDVPVSGVVISVKNIRTGNVHSARETMMAGKYCVVNDSDMNGIRTSGDYLLLDGTGDGKSFTALWQVGTDDCRCHVEKRSGPDLVVMK